MGHLDWSSLAGHLEDAKTRIKVEETLNLQRHRVDILNVTISGTIIFYTNLNKDFMVAAVKSNAFVR